MAGSGGSYDPRKIRSEVQQLEGKIDRAAYDANVAQLLGSVLADANDRDAAQIEAHLKTIKDAIEKETDGFVDLLFGGSVSKNTWVAGVSDVDALVVINDSELAGKTPIEVRDHFIARLRDRLPNTDVQPDGFAVCVKYADGVVQLVPVKRAGNDFLLPNPECTDWSRVRPRAFTEALTAMNRSMNGKVIPTIKLAKVALAELPADRRPSGYHLESMALDIFANYTGPRTPKEMVTHFFERASQHVLHPVVDRTGQSRHVDEKLGPAGSLERQIVGDILGRIARRLHNADAATSLEHWKRVFGVE